MKKRLFGIVTFLGIGFSFCSADYSIYHNSELGLISVYDGTTGITLQDKNLGAENLNDYGHYYQWGNNFGFDNGINTSQTSYDFSVYTGNNYYSFASFCTNKNGCFYQYDTKRWDGFLNVWGDGGDSSRRKGPCSDGFHVPLVSEFQSLINVGLSVSDFNSIFYIPLAGYIHYGGIKSFNGSNYYLWTSQYDSNNGDTRYFSSLFGSSSSYSVSYAFATIGMSVRCFSDNFVIPDSSWTLVYGDLQTLPSGGGCPESSIDVYYNNGNSTSSITCDGIQAIEIEGLSSTTSTNTRTPYFNINYHDEDNQLLTESYSKSILYLSGGLYKKTYTGNNDWILNVMNIQKEPNFTGYVPTFIITGSVNDVDTGNVFYNFSDNALKVLLSNIPSYIQYITIFFILLFLFGFIRRFKRKR